MIRRLILLAAIAVLALMLSVAPAAADPPSCNWGQLTADSIADGFPQGPHSSDPSGDGHGPVRLMSRGSAWLTLSSGEI